MRKIVYAMIVSFDCYIAGPNQDIGWTIVDEELHTHFNQLESSAGVQLYGRQLYEVIRYWGTAHTKPASPPSETGSFVGG